MKKVIAIIGSFMFGFVLGALMSSNKKRGLIDDVEYIPNSGMISTTHSICNTYIISDYFNI